MEFLNILKTLDEKFSKHNFKIYAVGGTVRDYMLGLDVLDFDFVTDATPEEIETFLEVQNNKFAKYGYVKVILDGQYVDITTLRIDNGYSDKRHPNSVTFISDIGKDYLRRDFTMNSLYMECSGKIYDFCNGKEDIENKIIRVIGDSNLRIKEDPLRILRAIRFAKVLNFSLDNELKKAIIANIHFVNSLNESKILEECKKANLSRKEMFELLDSLCS